MVIIKKRMFKSEHRIIGIMNGIDNSLPGCSYFHPFMDVLEMCINIFS
jgi:hypothetical protein